MEFVTQNNYIILILILTFVLFVLLYRYFIYSKKFENKSFWNKLSLNKCFLTKNGVRILVLFLSTVLVAFSLLRPTFGEKLVVTEVNGADVLFVLDVSNSMKAEDMNIGMRKLNRLTASKLLISDMVSTHPENRYGLVLFAGDAFVSSPLTTDTNAFLTFLDTASPNDVTKQGTNLSSALNMSFNRFVENAENKERGKAVILISDGGEEMPEDLPVMGEKMKDASVRVFTLGVGGDNGVPIPEASDVFGRVVYKKHNGKIVYTTLNDKPLKELANITGGEYIHLESGGDLNKVAKELRSLPTSKINKKTNKESKEVFYIFLIFGFLLWVVYIFSNVICVYIKRAKLTLSGNKK